MTTANLDPTNMVRRRTHRRRPSGRRDTYEAVVIAGERLDGRSGPARLFRHLEDQIHAELGGREHLTTAQLQLARRAATLSLQAELAERSLLQGDQVSAPEFRATCAELRRVLEALGLSKVSAAPARQPDPGDAYAEALRAAERQEAERRTVEAMQARAEGCD